VIAALSEKNMETKWKIGDIVSRDGTDEQEIIDIDYEWMCMTVKCIKEPKEKWIKKGETEFNLIRRYSLVRTT